MLGTVTENQAEHRFELPIDEGVLALAYYQTDGGRLVLTHTEVRSDYAGQGVATQFANGTFDLVRKSRREVVLKCPFMADFYVRRPDYRDIVAG